MSDIRRVQDSTGAPQIDKQTLNLMEEAPTNKAASSPTVVANSGTVGALHTNVIHNFYGQINGTVRGSLSSERQSLFFKFFRQALKQAETTFRLSVAFMTGGAAIILTGGVLALLHAGETSPVYLSAVTSLSGALIATGGGALAIHANRARKHLTAQANQLDLRIEEDHQLEKARGLIGLIKDPQLQDRLNAMTAMRVLKMEPNPELATDRILPREGQAEIDDRRPQ